MSNHTSAPWTVKTYSNSRVKDAVGVFGGKGGQLLICEAAYGATMEESDANARLISAAPELLAALRDAAAFLDYVPGTHPTALVERMRAAIAKASE